MGSSDPSPWSIYCDTGGTFTDCLAIAPDGSMHQLKILSTGALRLRGTVDTRHPHQLHVELEDRFPDQFFAGFSLTTIGDEVRRFCVQDYQSSTRTLILDRPLSTSPSCSVDLQSSLATPVLAAHLITKTPLSQLLPPLTLRLATTRATNALLTRTGARTALLITRGFGDLPWIGTQQRPDLFALDIEKPSPLVSIVIEVDERIRADGSIAQPLDPTCFPAILATLQAHQVESVAIALLNSHKNREHELKLGATLAQQGFRSIVQSAALASTIGLLDRLQTAVVSAYLNPTIDRYLGEIQHEARSTTLMTSSGGLVSPQQFQAKDSLLSGPAGGVIGARTVGRRSGFSKLISFDMGGTSTDVARIDDAVEYRFEQIVDGIRIVVPNLAIETVAAGGGSICRFEKGDLVIGPESAGAVPGPSCYGAGGPLTVTDLNLLLGRLDAARFAIPIDRSAAEASATALFRDVVGFQGPLAAPIGSEPHVEAFLAGLLEIANDKMADAIRRVSIRCGYAPTDYALMAFGGAGGQHACFIAERLDIHTVVMPADAGLLSAVGLKHATLSRIAHEQLLKRVDDSEPTLDRLVDTLVGRATIELHQAGVPTTAELTQRLLLDVRYVGQDDALTFDYDPSRPIREQFERRYLDIYGQRLPQPLELVSVSVIVSEQSPDATDAPPVAVEIPQTSIRYQKVFFDQWIDCPLFNRPRLPIGATILGPALIVDQTSTTLIPPGWRARVDSTFAILIQKESPLESTDNRRTARRITALSREIFSQRLIAIADEMGESLRRTALSINIKERRDFSCAILDADGELVVNAPHVPVHLGALGVCVRAVREVVPIAPGEMVVANHPRFGGSHLPDITLIAPIHGEDGELLAYVANRAHHAELGGRTPGSMPVHASRLIEEGVVIAPLKLSVTAPQDWNRLRRLLTAAPYPSRAVDENLADLRAQVAANRRGIKSLVELIRQHGVDQFIEQLREIKTHAAEKLAAALRRQPDFSRQAQECLDDGTLIKVRLTKHRDQLRVDFSGSGGQHPGNLNATPAIVQACVLYVVRLLINEPIPLNEGLLRPLSLILPSGFLNPVFDDDPSRCPAVVGGNTEVSQRIVDTLLKALELSACSQGTMNNVLFGNDRFGYYETIGGGAGGTVTRDGASGVHTHMTNTRMTDAEILEFRYPIEIEQFALRHGSGGNGARRGGEGLIRRYRFVAPMTVSILTQHREVQPYGVLGGEPGQSGRQALIRQSGETIILKAIDQFDAAIGDRLTIETPGGGGWGIPDPARTVV